MAKVGFEHHGRFNSVSARKMLSARGGRASAKTHAADGWLHLERIRPAALASRQRQAAVKRLLNLEAYWEKVFGEPLVVAVMRMQQ